MESCGGDIAFLPRSGHTMLLTPSPLPCPKDFPTSQEAPVILLFSTEDPHSTEVIADPLINIGPAGTKLMFIRQPSWNYSDYYDCSTDYDRIIFNAVPSCKATGDYNYSMEAKAGTSFMPTRPGYAG